MKQPELARSVIGQLLQDARSWATEAGLHRLPDVFLEKVQPCLDAIAFDAFGGGIPVSILQSRIAAEEALYRRRVEALAAIRGEDAGQFAEKRTVSQWRIELNIFSVCVLGALAVEIVGGVRLNPQQWLAIILGGTLIACNARVSARWFDRLQRRLRLDFSARRTAGKIRRLRAAAAHEDDRAGLRRRWVELHQPVIVAEYTGCIRRVLLPRRNGKKPVSQNGKEITNE